MKTSSAYKDIVTTSPATQFKQRTVQAPAEGFRDRFQATQAGARFGFNVATAGDVNRDGYDDIVFTGPNHHNGRCDEGTVFFCFETGITDNILARNVTNNAVGLKFNVASDGDCRTLDGDRQDLLALMTDLLDNAVAPVCVISAVEGVPFETCMPVSVKNRGNR